MVKSEVQDFQYGPAQVVSLSDGIKGKDGKEYRVTVFKNNPFYPLASSITCGEKVQVRGWVEKYGPVLALRVYQFKKPAKKSPLKECLASSSSKKPAPITAEKI